MTQRDCNNQSDPLLRRGFSLIELLVVLGVVSLLIGLLVPALQAARGQSESAACGSNLRQLTLANLQYATESRGRLAPGASNFRQNLNRWHGTRDSVYEVFTPEGGPLSEHLGPDGAVRRCPTFDLIEAEPGIDFEAGCGGYGYNNTWLGVSRDGENDETGVRLSAIERPADTLMFADTAFLIAWPSVRMIEYSFAEPPKNRSGNADLDPSLHFRHDGRSLNIAWADGHIGSATFEWTRSNIYGVGEERHEQAGIGWFGDRTNDAFDLR